MIIGILLVFNTNVRRSLYNTRIWSVFFQVLHVSPIDLFLVRHFLVLHFKVIQVNGSAVDIRYVRTYLIRRP